MGLQWYVNGSTMVTEVEERSLIMENKEQTKTQRLQIRVSSDEKKQIEKEAKALHLNTAAYVRAKLLSEKNIQAGF